MAVITDRIKLDGEIRAAKAAGMKIKDIAFCLGVHYWIVTDAFKRLNLSERNHFSEIEIIETRPLVQKTCPLCRQRHMSSPAVWTCDICREAQDRDNTAGCGDAYLYS